MASAIETYLRQVVDPAAPKAGIGPAAIRAGLGGLAGLYGAGLSLYLDAEKTGIRRREKLPLPVVSVGNLAVGGTGKTPMTAMLCRALQDKGLRPGILSRGHGGSSQDVRIVSEGDGRVLLTAEDAGDEPVLLARACPGVPLLVGKDRRQSGREAMRRWPLDLLILDDGFQYWQLARDLDLVLLDSLLPFDNGHALPRGLLREPAANLRRAGMIVVTRAGRLAGDDAREALTRRIRALAPDAPVFFADHQAECLVTVDAGPVAAKPLDTLSGASVVALSAIAQPVSFYETLAASCGCRIAARIAKDDHGVLGPDDVEEVLKAVRNSGADAVVMTEKDAVKWPADLWSGDTPVYALRIAMRVEEQDAFLTDLLLRAGIKKH